jgi:putative flavoprotein involved in K+ transport
MPQTTILIVGGGAAGLSAAGALKQYNIESVILDKDAATGDIWRQRYERLHLHTVRMFSHSAYKKLPSEFPTYVPKEKFADYLVDYAKHFNLDIRHKTTVTNISKKADGYLVETESGEHWEAPILIIATGINRIPFTPDWEGKDSFKGEFSHAISYKTGRDYQGKRVLVVGLGNTGAEICADLVEQGAAYVASSVRTFPTIVKRDPLGIPVHIMGFLMLPFPVPVKDFMTSLVNRLELGDLSKYGIQKPAWQIFKNKRIPMIDVGYVGFLKQGKITVKPDIRRLDEMGVQFVDGSREDYDAVIAATGYTTGLEQILDIPNVIDAEGNLTVTNGEPNQHKGLWFIGLEDNPAGVLMQARIRARGMAKKIAAEVAASR